MSEAYEEQISRRRALALMAGVGAGLVLPEVSGAAAFAARPAASATGGASTIMLVRHAERPTAAGVAPFGIDPMGDQDIASLTVRGWTRAGALVELFAPASGAIRPGLVRPTAGLELHAGTATAPRR